MIKKIKFEKSSGNVFEDIGLVDSDELYIRAKIGILVFQLLEGRKQKDIMNVLAIDHQAEVSHLMNGHFNRFSVEKLMDFLKRLNQKISIQVSDHKKGEPFQEVAFAQR